jgi:hypothetical protein
MIDKNNSAVFSYFTSSFSPVMLLPDGLFLICGGLELLFEGK